jgi:WhiB family redox-sensing transcriptional regulator
MSAAVPRPGFDVLVDGDDQAWRERAACKDWPRPDEWFPHSGNPPGALVQTCRSCPVAAECLAYAVPRPNLHGIWSATSADDRDRIRRRLASAS